MVLALVLSIMSSRSAGVTSVIQVQPPTTTAPQPVLPGLGGEGAGGSTPAPVETPSAPSGN
jgi:hypothetical protein